MDIESEVPTSLLGLAEDLRAALRQALFLARRLDNGTELSSAKLTLLTMLRDGGLRVGEIAVNLGVQMPSATEMIKTLEASGLLRRYDDPDDSRAVRVSLTEEGSGLVQRANDRRNAHLAQLLKSLSAQDRDKLSMALPVFSQLRDIQAATNANSESTSFMRTSSVTTNAGPATAKGTDKGHKPG